MPIFPDSLNYKELGKIKGVTVNPDGAFRIYTPQHGEMNYDITTKAGDDVYSELDELAHNSIVKDARHKYVETMHRWGNPALMEESLKELQPILQTFINSPSIEEAVDEFEKKYWGVEDNTFKNIIDSLIHSDSDIIGTENLDELINKKGYVNQITPKSVEDDMVI